ncbi:MAG: hypothetical protein ACRDQB_08850, partial [Thermocrispum sp.]
MTAAKAQPLPDANRGGTERPSSPPASEAREQAHRTAEEIGRTPRGPRPLPELGEQRAAADLTAVDTVLP